jgi:hypothetical protein
MWLRLVATPTGAPDGLEDEMPSIFMQQMDPQELARKYGSFAVLNRPHTMVMLVNNPTLMARFVEVRRPPRCCSLPLPPRRVYVWFSEPTHPPSGQWGPVPVPDTPRPIHARRRAERLTTARRWGGRTTSSLRRRTMCCSRTSPT